MFRARTKSPLTARRHRRNSKNWKKPWTPGIKHKSRASTGPANNTIPELKNYFFDCSSIHEADRFISSKKAIIAYLGAKYGGDIKATLENMQVFEPDEPDDPATKYSNDVDDEGKITRYAREKMSYKEQKRFDNEMAVFVKRKQNLANTMEQAYCIFLDQCTEFLQDKMKNSKKWATISSTQNVINLLELMQ